MWDAIATVTVGVIVGTAISDWPAASSAVLTAVYIQISSHSSLYPEGPGFNDCHGLWSVFCGPTSAFTCGRRA